jgi:threonylcarbamoyladenosine tRNA methylthiotransferase MtaB
MKKTIAITTLGCKVNQFESASFITGFIDAGCTMVPFSGPADIYVINTCAVTARAGQQSRQMVRRAMRANPDARIVVTGCYAQIAGEELLEIIDNPACIVGNGNKHLLVETALAENSPELVMLTGNIGMKKEICSLPVHRFSGRTRSYLRIQDGCNNFCSYCIVPYSRGRSRSLPKSAVFEQLDIFLHEGYREMVITGINVGKYGLELDEKEDIYTLLDALCRNYPEMRIRLSSIEPVEVNDHLFNLMARHTNFMPHLHIPLQSGDDRILTRMNRHYTVEVFVDVIRKISSAFPHAAIGCDVLAGFPGEDEQAAENTFQLLAGLPVSYLHVFPYSRRPGTLAASFKKQVAGKIKDARVRRLRQLDQEKRQAFYRRQLNSAHQVLVERRNKRTGLLQGFSENYIPLQFAGPSHLSRTVVPVLFDRVEDGQPTGTLEVERDLSS